jgi:hypothetical protein
LTTNYTFDNIPPLALPPALFAREPGQRLRSLKI